MYTQEELANQLPQLQLKASSTTSPNIFIKNTSLTAKYRECYELKQGTKLVIIYVGNYLLLEFTEL
jgi:hypothetical protein